MAVREASFVDSGMFVGWGVSCVCTDGSDAGSSAYVVGHGMVGFPSGMDVGDETGSSYANVSVVSESLYVSVLWSVVCGCGGTAPSSLTAVP